MGASSGEDRAVVNGAASVSALRASVPSAWRADAFRVRTQRGDQVIAGWVCEPFALDFRVYDVGEEDYDLQRQGWCLTHLPTGFQVVGILTSLAEAFDIADEFRAAADWSFADPACAVDRKAAVRPLFDKHGEDLTRGHSVFAPLFVGEDAQAIEARRAETGTGSVHESAVAKPCAQPPSPSPSNRNP